MKIIAYSGTQQKSYNADIWRVLRGDERPDIGWLGRPYKTFDNVPLLENKVYGKGTGIDVTQHWPNILAYNPDSGGFTQAQKEAWLLSGEDGTDMVIMYDELTKRYRQHTPEVSGGALVKSIGVDDNFLMIECWVNSSPLPAALPSYLLYTWRALRPPAPGHPTGISYIPRGGVQFPILYWRSWAYLPLEWVVRL